MIYLEKVIFNFGGDNSEFMQTLLSLFKDIIDGNTLKNNLYCDSRYNNRISDRKL